MSTCDHHNEHKSSEHEGMRQVVCVDCGHEWHRLKVTWRTLADEAKPAQLSDRKAAVDDRPE